MSTRTPLYKIYYIYHIAYFTEVAFQQILLKPASDFGDMMLHHILTINLIITSYVMNVGPIGSITLLITDFSDATTYLGRILSDFTGPIGRSTIYAFLVANYIYCRLFLFPMVIIVGYQYIPLLDGSYFPINFIVTKLTLIGFMNFYWFYNVFMVWIGFI